MKILSIVLLAVLWAGSAQAMGGWWVHSGGYGYTVYNPAHCHAGFACRGDKVQNSIRYDMPIIFHHHY